MQKAPKSLRLQIALMGRVNAGKSSFLNLLTGQETAITSPQAGTTTDMVEKNQELLPLGPITWIDTAGFGDESALGEKRLAKTQKAFDKADIILLITEQGKIGTAETFILNEAKTRQIPVIIINNKADTAEQTQGEGLWVNSLDKSSRDKVLNALKAELIKLVPEDFITPPPLLGDLLPEHGTIVMIIPIDFEAPKGRLIMPQVQAIRDALDHNQTVIMLKEDEYQTFLRRLGFVPDLVVCDSQVVDKMVAQTPAQIKCTTFSTLFARLKGDINKFVEGAGMIKHLQDGDKVLIAEFCTHHAVEDDIGRVKIPRWLVQKSGKQLQIDHVAGPDFPKNLKDYKLVIQCGGCMNNRREILSRINKCEAAGVAITNYGICISELKGVLERILQPFPEALKKYHNPQEE